MKLYKKLFFGTLACAALCITPVVVTSCSGSNSDNSTVNPNPSVPEQGSDWKEQKIAGNTNPQIFLKYIYAPSDAAKTLIPEETFMRLVNRYAQDPEAKTLIDNKSQLYFSIVGDIFTSDWIHELKQGETSIKFEVKKEIFLTPETSGDHVGLYKNTMVGAPVGETEPPQITFIPENEVKNIDKTFQI